MAVVRNTGEERGDFTLRLENTETGQSQDETFSLDEGEERSVSMATVVPRPGTDLNISILHAETTDDSRTIHAEPTAFGFAKIRRFSPPLEMRPGGAFDIQAEVANTGECRDEFLISMRDTDTGEELLRETSFLEPGESVVWTYHATMVGRRWNMIAETYLTGVRGWEYNDSKSATVTPVECVILSTADGTCEFRGPMAAVAGSVVGSGIEFVGFERGEERAALFPGARFAAFAGRVDRGEVKEVEFTSISDIRAKTELGIATVVNRTVTSLDTQEFKYSTLLPQPLVRSLGLLGRIFRRRR